MSDNSWYENGELPPVGRKVVFKSIAPSKRHLSECDVIILAHVIAPNGQPCAVYCSENCNNDPANGIAVGKCFRPIKTERELAIEAAVKKLSITFYDKGELASMAGLLFDAGLLRYKNEAL